jgi:hypothetical protein
MVCNTNTISEGGSSINMHIRHAFRLVTLLREILMGFTDSEINAETGIPLEELEEVRELYAQEKQ